jgi:hypothetical protein
MLQHNGQKIIWRRKYSFAVAFADEVEALLKY